jgi:hypothetical protein
MRLLQRGLVSMAEGYAFDESVATGIKALNSRAI